MTDTLKPRRLLTNVLAVLAIAGSIAACDIETYSEAAASTQGGTSSNPPPQDPPPQDPPPPGASFGPNFSEIQAGLFTPSCSGCHGGGNPSGGLNLEAANSYANLVGIDSTAAAGTQRVNAGNPDMSYLIQRLEGTSGALMPPSGMIPQADIDMVREWITAGAIDDTVVVLDPIQVSSLTPAPNATLTTVPMQIVAGFTRDLDVSTVNAMTYTLTASGGDGNFNSGNEVQITAAGIMVPGANQSSAVFDLTGVALADDTYRVTLFGSGANMIMDLDANALDGEFSGAFPSGDGTAGGDFIAQFTLSTAPAPVTVVSLTPAPNATLQTPPTQITAGFSQDLDPATVNATTFTLTASGGDGNFNSGNEVQINGASVMRGLNPATAVFDLTGVTLANDTYQVTMFGTGANVIMDVNGNALDGEFVAAFPSGNGTAGGDFVARFTVAVPSALDMIQASIFGPRCASCHSGVGSLSGIDNMDLSTADSSHATLVDVTSAQDGNFVRVVPFQPDDSYLVHKLEGNATVGGFMPPTGMLLPADIATIRQWITDGAER